MERRTFLRATAGVAAGGLAGCAAPGGPGGTDSDSNPVTERVDVLVRNYDTEGHEVTVRAVDERSTERYEKTFTLPGASDGNPGKAGAVNAVERSTWRVTVTAPGLPDARSTWEPMDCTSVGILVHVGADGTTSIRNACAGDA